MNRTLLMQSLKQMWGIILLEYRYHGNLPGAGDYCGTVKYSLPFHEKWTVVNGGVSREVSHSWEIPTQRYAYDFVILDQDGKSYKGREDNPASFYCYGKDVLAPADGIVVEVQDGSPDSRITAERRASCEGRDLRGNCVLLRHEEKEYSLLAHLKSRSIQVKIGQEVRRGEKIAQCGNSGNSSEPHLHFQLQAEPSFYSSPGLPICFDGICVESAPGYDLFDGREIPQRFKNAYPPYITRGQRVWNQGEGERSPWDKT